MNAKYLSLTIVLRSLVSSSLVLSAAAFGQSSTLQTTAYAGPQSSSQGPRAEAQPAPQGEAVSYASVTQLNGLLAQLEATSKAAQDDLSKLRIEKWKTDASTK